MAYRPHPVDAARQKLDIAAGILTGDPSAGTEILEKRLEREELDGSSQRDSQEIGPSAGIATISNCDASLRPVAGSTRGTIMHFLKPVTRASTQPYGSSPAASVRTAPSVELSTMSV
jgi:hypothetical protein